MTVAHPWRRAVSVRRGARQYRRDLRERERELAAAEALLTPGLLPAEGRRRTVVAHAWAAGEPRRALCSGAVGAHAALLEVSAVTLARYARRHRWDLVLSREHLAGDRPPAWGKIALTRELLADYDVVGWVDADAIVVDDATDLGNELDDNHDFYIAAMTGGIPPTEVVNPGVYVVRATAWAERFLATVWAQDDLGPGRWENWAILRLLGWDLTAQPPRLTARAPWWERVKLIDPRWNSIPHWGRAERPRIVHHGGLPLGVRRPLLLDDLAAHAGVGLDDLPALLNRLGLVDVGVAVGIGDGDTAAWILHRWAGNRLISVEPCAAPAVVHRLAPFGTRSSLWPMTGREALRHVGDGSLAFVILDAEHTGDLPRWRSKLRPGGVAATTGWSLPFPSP